MDKITTLINYIKDSKNIVFFGGAGVSTESGLKDFRSKDGLYNEKYKYNPEEILSHHFFMENPNEFYKFYKDKLNSLNYKPNKTHYVLKKMEDKKILSAIITQNIDGFHSMVGNKNVYELHGSVLRNYCTSCHKFYDGDYVFNSKEIPRCSCGSIIKPDVVLYEEPLNEEILINSIKKIEEADLLIIGGTSLTVYPAAALINYFHGKHIILINKDKTEKDNLADLVINENITDIFKSIEKELHL